MNSCMISAVVILFVQILYVQADLDLPKTVNGEPVNEDLYNFMMQLSDVSEPLRLALGWNVQNELSILPEFAYELEWYEIAMKEIADGAQKILNSTLEDMKYKEKVNIRQFVNSIQEHLKTGNVSDRKMAELAKKIYAYRKKQYESKQKKSD